jgi:hypothetical protein
MGEILIEFQEQAERCLRLKKSSLSVCKLILRPPDDRFWPTDHLEEAVGRLQAMQEEHQEAVVKLRALQSSTTWV